MQDVIKFMIETTPSAELARNGLKNGAIQTWSHAFLEKCRPWFYVDWCDNKKHSPTQAIMLGTPDILKEFSEQHPKSIKTVYIVTPPHINGSNDWKLEPLSSISVLPGMTDECQVYIYELRNGIRYADLRVDDLSELQSTDTFLQIR